jgi:tRNA threonylcarbamoyl adenosine modification protein (Sua5/YciO/YrdC/YwlC family)
MKTEVIRINTDKPEKQKIDKAANIIREGGLVVIPTETVYGIAANSLDKKAVERLYAVKKRPKDKPFSLHISSKEEAEIYAVNILPLAYRLMESFWPGPLTLVLKNKDKESVGMRMPDQKVALSIIEEADVPVVCPSANLSDNPPPTTCEEALKDLDGLVDLVVDCGRTALGKESTVVDVTQAPVKIIREGAISKEAIETVANKKVVLFICTGNSCRSVMAEELLKKKLKDLGRKDIEVISAGTMMTNVLGMSEYTGELLEREGIEDLSRRSQSVTKEMIKRSDIILIMEKLHEDRILQLAPEAKFRVFLLKEFAKIKDNNLDIADPIGRTLEFYEDTFRIIKEAVEKIAQVI